MYPTLFRIGHFSVATYGVLVALAVWVGGWVAARGFRERKFAPEDAWSLVVWGVLAGFAGGRVYYVLLKGDLSALWSRGGFVWYGGLIGGAAAVALAARHKGLPLGAVADAFAPALALGHAIGHLGCFFSGDSYGLPSSLPWAVAFPSGMPPSTAGVLRREFGVTLPPDVPDGALLTVHPTMLYSAAALTVVFAILWILRRGPRAPGWLFGLYLVLAGTERFLVEFLRAKDDRFLWGFTTAQAIALIALATGVALLALRRQRGAHQPAAAGAQVTDLADRPGRGAARRSRRPGPGSRSSRGGVRP